MGFINDKDKSLAVDYFNVTCIKPAVLIPDIAHLLNRSDD